MISHNINSAKTANKQQAMSQNQTTAFLSQAVNVIHLLKDLRVHKPIEEETSLGVIVIAYQYNTSQ